jgi:hypothetical protein
MDKDNFNANISELNLSELTLNALAATISDTAVDVFVYDTSKDSDGGAWRKRTQHTSWYNEALNTATRGSRKEFPAVAVIVAESNQVTIYDGDDPDLPMWMVFNVGRSPVAALNWYSGSTATLTAVSQLNGRLCVGTGGGVTQFGFVEDAIYLSYNGSTAYAPNSNSVLFRNNTNATGVGSSSAYFYFIVNQYVNDVAMTVLPNAPIDAATGLPVPTIAVATDTGVSVIRDDGNVVDISNTNTTYDYVHSVNFYDGGLYFPMGNGSNYLVYYYAFWTIPTADTVLTVNTKTGSGQDADAFYRWDQTNNLYTDLKYAGDYPNTFFVDGIGPHTGSTYALQLIDENKSDPAKGMVAQITSEYNTGWQAGKGIKLATLSDTDDTDVTGSELVTNGSMEANNSWEAVGTPTASGQSSDGAHSGTYSWYFTGNGNYDGIQSSVDFSITSGKAYVVDAWVYPVNDTGITLKLGGVNRTVTGLTQGAWNQVTETIVSTQTTTAGTIGFNTDITWGGGTWYIDDVSVRLAEEDRSVNGKGLQVFGTVTKNPVNTGADLVAYSGFASGGTSYLEQPYNSDLDFSGDFCFIAWVYGGDADSAYPFSYGGPNGGGSDKLIFLRTYSSSYQFGTYDATDGTNTVTGPSVSNNWHCLCGLRRGGTVEFYHNGVLQGSYTRDHDFTGTSTHKVRVGLPPWNTGPFDVGSVALARISETAPSPEQIAKIYEDEKVLFQENAQATLYGSSDAVTALAYDDATNILSVGTSAGRSDFQGLRRVNNTTNAVGAAISASNGLIVEE